MEEQLYNAARTGDAAEVEKILNDYPSIDVNWKKNSDMSALHVACSKGHKSVVAVLLSHPSITDRIDINCKNLIGSTPFAKACYQGRTECVRLLLKDPRVNVTKANAYNHSPLRLTADEGHLDVIKQWIASGRELEIAPPGGEGNYKVDAIAAAKRMDRLEVVALLENFKTQPDQTRYEIRVELGYFDELAANLFALIIFLCDGLLNIKQSEGMNKLGRFFNIARQLPMELQMMLCYRAVASMRVNILTQTSEAAFRTLAQTLS